MPDAPTLPSFTALYAFGDSLSDAGNLSITTGLSGSPTPTSPYFQETYSTPIGHLTATGRVFSNGPTWAQTLSQALGLGTLAPSLLGGTDFAYGGAETGTTPLNAGDANEQAISLPSQIAQFELAVPGPSADALYTISIGANDLLDILANPELSAQQQQTDVAVSVANELADVEALVRNGARDLLVMDVPDLGKTPEVLEGLANGSNTPSPAFDAFATQLTAEYDGELYAGLAAIGGANRALDIHLVDAYAVVDAAVANPAAFGLTNVTSPVWSGSFSDPNSGTLAATGAAQNQYLFWDHFHPTETGHLGLTALAEQVLTTGSLACFAAGTRLATPAGEIPVEDLRVGMLLHTRRGPGPVRWVGHRRIDCRRHAKPREVWPVRVRAGAFGPARPRRDLLLSPDHAVFVAGVLIPIRYLVNGRTIAQEPCDTITYWHVELPCHEVVLAEGLPAESYLDTGNRGSFAEAAPAAAPAPAESLRIWARSGCAPLVLGGARLAAVRRELLARAEQLGHVRTADPDLRAVTRGGRVLRPRVAGRRHRFSLPAAARAVRLVSRSGVPAELREDSPDHRRLGIAVSRLSYAGRQIPLSDPRLQSGWHALECERGAPAWRWTDGDAGIEVPGGRILEVELAMTGLHWREEAAAPA
jgi:phospholipase/lecithinase/hemolysin